MTGTRQKIDYHEQLSHYVLGSIMPTARSEGIDDHKESKAYGHHLEKFDIVATQEDPRTPSRTSAFHLLVFDYQSITAQKQEHWHTIMPPIREDMHKKHVGTLGQFIQKQLTVAYIKDILVFLDRRRKPMAIVVHDDGNDGKSPHGRTL